MITGANYLDTHRWTEVLPIIPAVQRTKLERCLNWRMVAQALRSKVVKIAAGHGMELARSEDMIKTSSGFLTVPGEHPTALRNLVSVQRSIYIDEVEGSEACKNAPLASVPFGAGSAFPLADDSPSPVGGPTLRPCHHLAAWHLRLRGVEVTAQYARVSRSHCEGGEDAFECVDLYPSVAGAWRHVRVMNLNLSIPQVDVNTQYAFWPQHPKSLRCGCGHWMATCGDLAVFPRTGSLKSGWSQRETISNVQQAPVDKGRSEKGESRASDLLKRDDIRFACQQGGDLGMCLCAPAIEIPRNQSHAATKGVVAL